MPRKYDCWVITLQSTLCSLNRLRAQFFSVFLHVHFSSLVKIYNVYPKNQLWGSWNKYLSVAFIIQVLKEVSHVVNPPLFPSIMCWGGQGRASSVSLITCGHLSPASLPAPGSLLASGAAVWRGEIVAMTVTLGVVSWGQNWRTV